MQSLVVIPCRVWRGYKPGGVGATCCWMALFYGDLMCLVSPFVMSRVGLLGCAMVDDGWRLERDGGLDMRYGRKD
jgi:hypothetical protein